MAMAKRRRRDSGREVYWRAVLARFSASGLSVRGFCVHEKLSEPSFYHWRRVIRERDGRRRGAATGFVPVIVHDEARGAGGAEIVIEFGGGRRLRLPPALPIRQVAELVHAIEAAPSTLERA
jgi:hypothetical protein